jgi:hypothetical protein
MGRPRTFSSEQLIERCRKLYKEFGISAFSFSQLKKHKLYSVLYGHGITQQILIERLGLEKEFEAFRHGWKRASMRANSSSSVMPSNGTS